MGKNHGAQDIVMAVNGIDAVEQRDFKAGFQRPGLQFIARIQPALRGIHRRFGAAAAQDGAEGVFLDVGVVAHTTEIGLHHLADFFVEGHLGQQSGGWKVVIGKRRRRTLIGEHSHDNNPWKDGAMPQKSLVHKKCGGENRTRRRAFGKS
jgi:hypothetical protein